MPLCFIECEDAAGFYRLSGSMKIRFSILPEVGVLQPEMFIEIDMGSWAFFQASPFYAAHGVAVYDSPIWWRNNLLIRFLLAVPVSWLFGPHSSTQLLPTLIIVVTSTLKWRSQAGLWATVASVCFALFASTLFSKSSPRIEWNICPTLMKGNWPHCEKWIFFVESLFNDVLRCRNRLSSRSRFSARSLGTWTWCFVVLFPACLLLIQL